MIGLVAQTTEVHAYLQLRRHRSAGHRQYNPRLIALCLPGGTSGWRIADADRFAVAIKFKPGGLNCNADITGLIVSVTGIEAGDPARPFAVICTLPLYVPGFKPVELTDTENCAGTVPLKTGRTIQL